MRYLPLAIAIALIPIGLLIWPSAPFWSVVLTLTGLIFSCVGIYDFFRHCAVRKNYPITSHLRAARVRRGSRRGRFR